MNPSEITLFNHIPKAGGSTLSHVLYSRYPNFFSTNNLWHWRKVLRREASWREGPLLIGGHYAPGAENLFPGDATVRRVTFLRKPLSFIRSSYTFGKAHNLHDRSALDFVRTFEANRITRYVGGGDLAAAKDALANGYDFFGLVERYGESFGLMEAALGFGVDSFEVRNRSADSGPLPEAVARRILFMNRADVELYAFALELFERRLAESARRDGFLPARERFGADEGSLPMVPGAVEALEIYGRAMGKHNAGDHAGAVEEFSALFPETPARYHESPFATVPMAIRYLEALSALGTPAALKRGAAYAETVATDFETGAAGASAIGDGPRWLLKEVLLSLAEICRRGGDKDGMARAFARAFAPQEGVRLHGRTLRAKIPDELFRKGASVLVVRSGPEALLLRLLDVARVAGECAVSIAIRADSPREACLTKGFKNFIPLPPGWFAFDAELRQKSPELFSGRFDSMVLLHDGVSDCVAYVEFLRLADAMGTPCYFFSAAHGGFPGGNSAKLFQVEDLSAAIAGYEAGPP